MLIESTYTIETFKISIDPLFYINSDSDSYKRISDGIISVPLQDTKYNGDSVNTEFMVSSSYEAR